MELRADAADKVGQRLVEVAIRALPEAVPRHDDMAAEMTLIVVEGGDVVTFLRPEKLRQDGGAVAGELAVERLPVLGGNPCLCGGIRRDRSDEIDEWLSHAIASLRISSRLRSMPQRKPAKSPLVRTTRWHGMASAMGLAAQAPATARGFASGLIHLASSM